MIGKFVLTSLVFALLFGTIARADQCDFRAAALHCMLNRSESLYLFPEHEKVWYNRFLSEPEGMVMSSFDTFRCPYCFAFVGTADGKFYEGQTNSIFDPVGNRWSVFLALKIDGQEQQEIFCMRPGRN